MASAEFGAEAVSLLPTVQVGDPFMEKLLLEACLEIFARDCLEGVQDMGAAGLTSSSVEMAARAGNGVELDLDAIPRRTRKLSPYEMLLSESQERMLMVAKKGREHEVLEVCAKWDLEAAVVGRVTDTGRFVCRATPGYDPLAPEPGPRRPVVVVDLPIGLLTDDAPSYDRPQRPPDIRKIGTGEMTAIAPGGLPGSAISDVEKELLTMIGSPNLGSRHWVYRQYDQIVGDGTVSRPGESDAAVVRVFCTDGSGTREKFLALSVDCNGRHVELDPFHGAAMAVAECCRNIVCAGGEPLGLTDCLNFANPERPDTMWRFARAVDGIAEACRKLEVPVVSGNVSFYNETDGRPILPTPTVAVVGQLRQADDRLGIGFRTPGHMIAMLGRPGEGLLGGSEWLFQRSGKVSGRPLQIDLDAELSLEKAVLALARDHVLASAHDVSDGGLGVCLTESCIAGNIGARIRLPAIQPLEGVLFGEEPSRVVVSFAPWLRSSVEKVAAAHGVPVTMLGAVDGDSLAFDGLCDVKVARLAEASRRCLAAIVGDE
jgi:phosphoribosylformylglycinamidine synthase